ncbi:MAG: hypothetical protein O4808_20215 [Trichodesmium sp. St17_bin3_1_1]|nr:hypothetical protein [Trichodesmium sp. St17_bin3_1_1]
MRKGNREQAIGNGQWVIAGVNFSECFSLQVRENNLERILGKFYCQQAQ